MFKLAPHYYTRDHLRSVRELCNSSGSIVARYSYDPYGRTTLVSGTNLATFQYSGMYQHAASGLNMTLYRSTYDPNLGRFLNRDPMEEEGGDNLYAYGDDDPSNEIDPLGLYPRRGTPVRPAPDFSVDPNSSDFPFITDTDNFHWYGNWGGPHTTSGSRKWREADNFPSGPQDAGWKAPINDRDICYYRHDVCLHNSGTIKEAGLRQAARAACDHNLAACLCASKQGGKVTKSEINEFSGPDCVHCHDPGTYEPNAKVYPYLY
jgi:RHS repeat-associated protein